MAKKSSAARQSAARRTQTATRASGSVLLVRPTESGAGTEAATKPAATAITATPVAKAATKAVSAGAPKREAPAATSTNVGNKTRSQAPVSKPVAPAPKPSVATKPAPVRAGGSRSGVPVNVQRAGGRGGRGMTAREQEIRLARARATQRARAANMITPEHYSYVLGDLRLILGVAIVFVAILVVLHFVLPQ